MSDPSAPANRLIHETSPYLRQHAHNPVDWYPWGEEALHQARALDRPIFLSIGYSACHWCHVMERESFENAPIAAFMNEHFINVKVDREERSDLDHIYMNAVMALTGHGGWPMSVFLTPDAQPFFGGTYWPPKSRMGMPGFADVLAKIHTVWTNQRDDVHRGAAELTAVLAQMGQARGKRGDLSEQVLEHALRTLLNTADRNHGGFGQAPKFPHPMDLRFLLRAWKRCGSQDALAVAVLTLDKMSRGGIYDHLGGGFHRYSTDARWLVPHFEKMLYDNALLAVAYLEAFQATSNADYARVVRETLDYVLREMTHPGGGFYSTQDADSEGEEGRFFVWSEEEITAALGEADARLFNYCYDLTVDGNWEGHNILNRIKTHAQAARVLGVSEDQLTAVLERSKAKLFAIREKRVHPGTDEKLLVAWNGLMISAFAQAALVLGEERYAQAALSAADFILAELRTPQGRLYHSYKDGQARFNAFLDDYAAFIDALIDVYQATFEPRYVESALELADILIAQFWDEADGGCFYTPSDHEQLIVRQKDTQDSATPSGNSLAATALLRLGRLCGRTDLEERGHKILEMLSGQLAQYPTASGQALLALDFLIGPAYEVVIAAGGDERQTREVLSALSRKFVPNKVVALKPHTLDDESLPMALEPLLRGKTAGAQSPAVYVCERGVCHAPISSLDQLPAALGTA